MSNDTADADADVASLLRDARLVYGGVLVDETPHLIECIDEPSFDEAGGVEETLAAAFASIGADLVPFVVDAGSELEDVEPAPSGPDTSGDHPRITTVDEAVAAVSQAATYYLLVNVEPGSWKRVRSAASGDFEEGSAVDDAETARYVVAAALVAETSDRIGDLPGVDGEAIEIIDWSG